MAKPRALAIEDDKEIAELYGRVLEPLGFESDLIARLFPRGKSDWIAL